MKTDDLIGLLAQGAGVAEPAGDGRRIALAVALSLPVMVLAVAFGLGILPLADWAVSKTMPKLVYASVVALAAVWLLRQAGRPGASMAGPAGVIVAVAGLAVCIGLFDLIRVPAEARAMQVMGKSWSVCPLLILFLSLPLQAGMLWAGRRLAPTRPGLAGLAGGLAAGGVAMAAYALHCNEPTLAFITVWYTLGIVLSGLFGWAIGARVLRW